MAVAKMPNKLRRTVSVPLRGSTTKRAEFDLTFTPHGMEIRLAGTSNRKVLWKPWREIIEGAQNRRKGYRVYDLESCVAQLEDVEDTLKKLES